MATKDEYPPLLPPGLHAMSLQDLKALTVDAFKLSNSRQGLWSNFESMMDTLSALKIPCVVWVDGSFVTQKTNPDDVDFVVDVAYDDLVTTSAAQMDYIQKLADKEFKKSHKLHSFVMFNAPAGHVAHADSVRVHNQWASDFGFSYVKREPKGIALVEVLP